MIEIVDGKYDFKYLDNMSILELKAYFKSFSSYEDFLKKEKLYFISPEKFNNWLYTIHYMDVDISTIASYKFLKSTGITIEKVKYDYDTIKILMKNYQSYQKDEYSRILNEFRAIVLQFNSS